MMFKSGRSKQYRFKQEIIIKSGLLGASEAIVRTNNIFEYVFSSPPAD